MQLRSPISLMLAQRCSEITNTCNTVIQDGLNPIKSNGCDDEYFTAKKYYHWRYVYNTKMDSLLLLKTELKLFLDLQALNTTKLTASPIKKLIIEGIAQFEKDLEYLQPDRYHLLNASYNKDGYLIEYDVPSDQTFYKKRVFPTLILILTKLKFNLGAYVSEAQTEHELEFLQKCETDQSLTNAPEPIKPADSVKPGFFGARSPQ